MKVVKAVYENGTVALEEPLSLPGKREVTVLIPEDGESSPVEALRFAGMLRDLSKAEETAFNRDLRRKVRFSRKPKT
jgi:predicted DNA-binding antitoxin AbrB/MazE fold protein